MHCVGYTDYAPHYTPDTIESILISSSEWSREGGGIGITPYPVGYNEFSQEFGYLDTKSSFVSNTNTLSHISFLITIGDISVVKLWGKGLSDVSIYLDQKVDTTVLLGEIHQGKAYQPMTHSVLWNHETVFHKDHAVLEHLPSGTHVLSLVSAEGVSSSLTHVVTWE